jgi:hypothetical protein
MNTNATNANVAAAAPAAPDLAAMRIRAPRAAAAGLSHAADAGGRRSRKALMVVVGAPGEPSSSRVLDAAALDAAVGAGLPRLATAPGGAAVDMADVLGAYDTGSELPVIFVDEAGGEETLTMFLYTGVNCH